MSLTADQFNAAFPIGTPVIAYPGLRPEHPAFAEFQSKRLETRTRSVAWTLGHGEPVVLVDGYAGGISLEHIDLVPATETVHAGTDTAHADVLARIERLLDNHAAEVHRKTLLSAAIHLDGIADQVEAKVAEYYGTASGIGPGTAAMVREAGKTLRTMAGGTR